MKKLTVSWRGEAGASKARLYLDDEWWMSVPAEVFFNAEVPDGAKLDEEQLRELEDKLVFERTVLFCVRSLSARAQSRGELERKLKQKEIPESVVERALARVGEYGYLNDVQLAGQLASEMRERGYGRMRVRSKLSVRGLRDPEAREAAQEALADDEGEKQAALEAIRRRRFRDEPKERQKAIAFLVRRGFSYGIAAETVRERLGELAEADEQTLLEAGDSAWGGEE